MTREAMPFNNHPSIAALLGKAVDATATFGREFEHYHRNLMDLRDRFSEGRFPGPFAGPSFFNF